VLACANRGPHTNGSQFYFLYKSAPHLDNKHTVFGKVVGGMDVLTKMEKVETDKKDRPLEDIVITGATVFVNPYLKEAEEEAAAEAAAKEKKLKKEGAVPREMGQWFSNPAGGTAGAKEGGVGRYLAAPASKKQKTTTGSAFDAW
jgi:peptidyl-prolyl cis-trans isomerase-like protein 2